MRWLSNVLILVGIALIIFIFGPTIKEEFKYNLNRLLHVKYSLDTEVTGTFEKPLTPPNTDFSIVIPKIAAVAPVVKNVDSQNKSAYTRALRQGVAHAKGTALPGDEGNVYLFAHSTDTFYNVGRYNAVFYLIGKLEKDDEIDVFFEGALHKYIVYDKKVVAAEAVQYLKDLGQDKTLTLQTCYPPGTAFKRLIVLAKQVEE